MTDEITVNELFAFSKKVSEANEEKATIEKVVRELTLFKYILKVSEKKTSRKFINVSIHSVTRTGDSESVVLMLENTSEFFKFQKQFWFVLIQHEAFGKVGRNHSHSFPFETELFEPACVEKFSFLFKPCDILLPLQIHVSLVFSLHFETEKFVKVFKLQDLHLDILHLLDPLRSDISQTCNLFPPSFFSVPEDEERLSSTNANFITSFSLKMSEDLREQFPKILLSDSVPRGFLLDQFIPLKDFTFYFQNEKIIMTVSEEFVSFRCFNPLVYSALKLSLFHRLRQVVGLCLSCDEKEFIPLPTLSLQCDYSATKREGINYTQFLNMLIKVREVSSHIKFSTTMK